MGKRNRIKKKRKSYLKEKVPGVSLSNPKLKLWQSEIGVRWSRPKQPPVQGMTVNEQLDLRAAYTEGDLVPGGVGQTERKRLHVNATVPARYVVKSKLVLTAAALQLQISANS